MLYGHQPTLRRSKPHNLVFDTEQLIISGRISNFLFSGGRVTQGNQRRRQKENSFWKDLRRREANEKASLRLDEEDFLAKKKNEKYVKALKKGKAIFLFSVYCGKMCVKAHGTYRKLSLSWEFRRVCRLFQREFAERQTSNWCRFLCRVNFSFHCKFAFWCNRQKVRLMSFCL